MRYSKHNFTMVEMLTVLAIIMILAGLLYPAITSARAKGRAAACLSNQKQVSMAITQSTNDNKGWFYSTDYTGDQDGTGTAAGNNDELRWTGRLRNRKYIQDLKVFRCPEIVITPDGAGQDRYTYGAAYVKKADEPKGFDFRGTKYFQSHTETDKEVSPGALVLGGDSFNTSTRSGGALMSFDGTQTAASYGKLATAHKNFVNLFFMDGHAAAVSDKELETNTTLYFPERQDKKTGASLIPKDKFEKTVH